MIRHWLKIGSEKDVLGKTKDDKSGIMDPYNP